MSLPPGTRIPDRLDSMAMRLREHMAFYRGMAEGLALGTLAGSITTACALALAWAHMGG